MIDLDQQSKGIIEGLLGDYIAQGSLYAFGSRVNGNSVSHSDLDLLIRTDEPIPFERYLTLKDALECSELPWVDLLDWQRISPKFRENIEKHCERWGC